ncbi:MAG: transposase [Methylococcales bacterium]|nr:transposase [Methylococcales bacterium]
MGEKNGSKRSVLTDEKEIPLALVLSGANTHDVKLLAETLDSWVVVRPIAEEPPQNLCLDAGYTGPSASDDVIARG